MDDPTTKHDRQGQHPIGAVAVRTGLAPEVIRVWERRYGVVHPARDGTGIRLYSDEEVDRLRLLARATYAGRRISQVARLPPAELRALVEGDDAARRNEGAGDAPSAGDVDEAAAAAVERALELTRALDGPALERDLRRHAVLLGLPRFLESIVGPLFHRIGDEWHAGRLGIAQEHMASSVARSLLTQLAPAVAGAGHAPRIVVATPAGERHEIGALMVAALAHAEGWTVTYLGPDLPAREIVDAALRTDARAVALSVVAEDGDELAAELAAVRAGLPSQVDVLLGGGAVASLGPLDGVRRLASSGALRAYLSAVTGPGASSSSMRRVR